MGDEVVFKNGGDVSRGKVEYEQRVGKETLFYVRLSDGFITPIRKNSLMILSINRESPPKTK